MRNLSATILALALLAAGACRENDLGSGVNTMDRDYARPAPDVWKAAVKSAEAADLKVIGDRHDRFGGELVAARANGSEVRILVKSLDDRSSRVAVRVEPGDRALANLLHERIADHVGLGEAKGGLFGGNTLDASYAIDLATARDAARKAFAVLGVAVTNQESHATTCRVDGRLKDSTPARIRMEKQGDLKVKVVFTAGNDRSDDNKAFVQRMKDEFETAARRDETR